MSTQSNDLTNPRDITLVRLFTVFAIIGLSGFGGVLPIARHELVVRHRWLSELEFTEILSICQFLPGPNVVNLTVTYGTRVRGIPGAIVATAGLLALPVGIAMGLAILYSEFSDVPQVRDAFRGIAAAAAGLLAAMAFKMAWAMGRAPRPLILVAIVIVAIAVFRLPLIYVILVMGPISVALAWWANNERS